MFNETGTRQTPYGFTGEYEDANGLLYLRARYLSSQFGNFLSLDPFEGMAARPMSLNGYSYVEGNPVNEIDPSGMCALSSVCGIPADAALQILFLYNFQDQASACDMPYQEGKNVLSYTAARETGAVDSDIRKSGHAKAALMMMQMNAYRTPNNAGTVGRWRIVGRNPREKGAYETFLNDANANGAGATDDERTLAGIFVNGYRSYCNPLAYFDPHNSNVNALIVDAVRRKYPDVAANFTGLQGLALRYGDASTALQNEFSIHADRVEYIKSVYSSDTGGQDVYVVPAGGRAVVITTANQTFPPLLAQCPGTAVAVTINGYPSQIGSLSASGNYTCHTSCIPADWYLYLGEGASDKDTIQVILGKALEVVGNYSIVSAAERLKIRWQGGNGQDPIRGGNLDYIKSCS